MTGTRFLKKVSRMKLFAPPIDLTSVNTIIYHLPNGPALSLRIDGIEEYVDLELEVGHVCDTSEIDGVLHFFPRGNA
jgi:hypothetical protein